MGICLQSKHSKSYDMGYITFQRLREDIAHYVYITAQKGTIAFLEQSDCAGKLTPKECKEFLQDIQNMEDKGTCYGYVGRGTEYCLTITKLKELLRNCIMYRCNLKWD